MAKANTQGTGPQRRSSALAALYHRIVFGHVTHVTRDGACHRTVHIHRRPQQEGHEISQRRNGWSANLGMSITW